MNIRLLIVDDNLDVIESLRGLLELSGFDVTQATSGTAALACHESNPADVVLVDLGMPFMNGFELVKGLKKASSVPLMLVAMTGWTRPDDVATAKAAGFDHYFTKPVDTDALELLIRGWVSDAGRLATHFSLLEAGPSTDPLNLGR